MSAFLLGSNKSGENVVHGQFLHLLDYSSLHHQHLCLPACLKALDPSRSLYSCLAWPGGSLSGPSARLFSFSWWSWQITSVSLTPSISQSCLKLLWTSASIAACWSDISPQRLSNCASAFLMVVSCCSGSRLSFLPSSSYILMAMMLATLGNTSPAEGLFICVTIQLHLFAIHCAEDSKP